MDCKHEQIRCTNCVKYCLKCGAELPKDFVPGAVAETAETPVKPQEKKPTRKKVK